MWLLIVIINKIVISNNQNDHKEKIITELYTEAIDCIYKDRFDYSKI